MKEQHMSSRQERRAHRVRKKRKSRISIVLLVTFIVTGVVVTQWNQILGLVGAFEHKILPTASQDQKTKGILVLGVDNDGGGLETGFTDSITYLASNSATNTTVALPIYRDARIPITCTGAQDNINRIYRTHGVECLTSSVSAFLDLPIDNYAIITMEGFYQIVEELGTITITPQESFCSSNGVLGATEYCFEADVAQQMSADQIIAYVRYRGGSSGENRADRQVQLIAAIKQQCETNALVCYQKITPHLTKAFKTNIGITEINTLFSLFGGGNKLESLGVIAGTNQEFDDGWTQIVDEDDLAYKTDIIKQKIFVS